ncbi:MAG: hypothetical protein WCQ95_11950 [Bacteroidota bacterium]
MYNAIDNSAEGISMALQALVTDNNNGMIIGNPNTDINKKLLFVRFAMAETIVMTTDNPTIPRSDTKQ